MTNQVWLEIDRGVGVAVDRADAMSMTEKQLVRLYRDHCYGRSRREAKAWAREQIRLRAAVSVTAEEASHE